MSFIILDVRANGIAFLTSFPDLLLLVYKWNTTFVFILHPENLPNSLLNSKSFRVATLGFCMLSSVQLSHSVVSDSFGLHGLQHARLTVYQQLTEIMQTHVHHVGDAIQPSHPLLFRSPLSFNLSQHQGLFQQVSSSHQVAKVLEFELQHQSFQ